VYLLNTVVQLVVGYITKISLGHFASKKNSGLSISDHKIQFCFFPFCYWATVSVVVVMLLLVSSRDCHKEKKLTSDGR
jgi:hypothetical protein